MSSTRITDIEVREGYRIRIEFEDGIDGVVDLSDLVGKGVFERWTDYAEFERATVDDETGTITWPGGIDLCPDSLYEEITGKSVLERSAPTA